MAERITKAWDWRKAIGGWTLPSDIPVRRVHAFDVNNNAACSPSHGLIKSIEPPTEGSLFCDDCIAVVKAQPEGRPEREYRRD